MVSVCVDHGESFQTCGSPMCRGFKGPPVTPADEAPFPSDFSHSFLAVDVVIWRRKREKKRKTKINH